MQLVIKCIGSNTICSFRILEWERHIEDKSEKELKLKLQFQADNYDKIVKTIENELQGTSKV